MSKPAKPLSNESVVLWLVPRKFRYRADIKDVMFLKHQGLARSRSVVRPTLDVTPTAPDL